MISFTRTASIAPGKTANAMRFGHDVAKFIKDKHDITLELMLPIGGNPARIGWHCRFEALAQWESLINGRQEVYGSRGEEQRFVPARFRPR